MANKSSTLNNQVDQFVEIPIDDNCDENGNVGAKVTITDQSRTSPLNDMKTTDQTSNKRRQRNAATKRVRTMLTNDWLADMVNNNMVPSDDSGRLGKSNRTTNEALSRLDAAIQLDDVSVRYQPFSIGQWFLLGGGGQTSATGSSTLGSSGKTGSKYCFKSLNTGFPCGKIFAIIGSPKCGKTSLLQVLAKIRKPSKGKVKYLGPDCKRHLSIGYMCQSGGSYFDQLSPSENMHLFGKVFLVKPVVIQNKLHRLLQLIGWERQHQPMGQLSPIEQTLTSLALATIHSPAILILDEPNFGADLFLKEHIWRQLKKLTRQEFVSIVFSTSFVEDVRFADEAAFVRGRNLVSCTLSSTKTESVHSNIRCGSANSSSVIEDDEDIKEDEDDDIQNLLSVDVEKIRHFVAQSYQNCTDDDEAGATKKPKSKPKKSSSSSSKDRVQLEMSSWYSDKHYQKTSLKRIHREPSFLAKFWLVLWLLLKLGLKRPFYLIGQLILPGLLIGAFNQFVGKNPKQIGVAVYNPDQPSIVSRHVLDSVDQHAIRLKSFDSLETALEAVRQNLVWAAIEFPSNYTNSMINRAIQNCDSNSDDFEDDEPESETISDNLLIGKISGISHHHSNSNKENGAIHRVRRDKTESSTELDSIEMEEDSVVEDSSNSNEMEGEGRLIPNNDLWNDLDVNRKKTRPINLVTVRLYVDNTNLLISGFVKEKVLQALQQAEQNPDVDQFEVKIPQPPTLKIVQPPIYGQVETSMASFLIPGITVVLVFLCSAILPLDMLDKIQRHTAYRSLQLAGIGRSTIVGCWALIQLSILLVQIAFVILILLYTVTEMTILGPVGLIYLVLYIEGSLALVQTALIRLVLTQNDNQNNGLLYTVIVQFGQFFYTVTIGGILWPVECLPETIQSLVLYLPQAISAETLRFVINRGWSFGHYLSEDNSVVFRGINIPLAWLGFLGLILVLNLKLNNN